MFKRSTSIWMTLFIALVFMACQSSNNLETASHDDSGAYDSGVNTSNQPREEGGGESQQTARKLPRVVTMSQTIGKVAALFMPGVSGGQFCLKQKVNPQYEGPPFSSELKAIYTDGTSHLSGQPTEMDPGAPARDVCIDNIDPGKVLANLKNVVTAAPGGDFEDAGESSALGGSVFKGFTAQQAGNHQGMDAVPYDPPEPPIEFIDYYTCAAYALVLGNRVVLEPQQQIEIDFTMTGSSAPTNASNLAYQTLAFARDQQEDCEIDMIFNNEGGSDPDVYFNRGQEFPTDTEDKFENGTSNGLFQMNALSWKGLSVGRHVDGMMHDSAGDVMFATDNNPLEPAQQMYISTYEDNLHGDGINEYHTEIIQDASEIGFPGDAMSATEKVTFFSKTADEPNEETENKLVVMLGEWDEATMHGEEANKTMIGVDIGEVVIDAGQASGFKYNRVTSDFLKPANFPTVTNYPVGYSNGSPATPTPALDKTVQVYATSGGTVKLTQGANAGKHLTFLAERDGDLWGRDPAKGGGVWQDTYAALGVYQSAHKRLGVWEYDPAQDVAVQIADNQLEAKIPGITACMDDAQSVSVRWNFLKYLIYTRFNVWTTAGFHWMMVIQRDNNQSCVFGIDNAGNFTQIMTGLPNTPAMEANSASLGGRYLGPAQDWLPFQSVMVGDGHPGGGPSYDSQWAQSDGFGALNDVTAYQTVDLVNKAWSFFAGVPIRTWIGAGMPGPMVMGAYFACPFSTLECDESAQGGFNNRGGFGFFIEP